MDAEQLTGPVAYHAEGPVWVDGLHWVDMLAGDVLALDPAGHVTRRHVGPVVAALRPRAEGGFVYALERGFARDRGPGTALEEMPELWSDPTVRLNEGGCDPQGRFYCGSMAYDTRPGAAALYRLDPDGATRKVLGDLTISNGLEWSPDGALAYFVDTPTGRIDVFDHDPIEGLVDRRPLVEFSQGSPDGLTVDAEGGIWVALWGGSAVHRYSPDGALTAVVRLPVQQVSACTFGGPAFATLFITTSREGLHEHEQSVAGSVFMVEPGVKGRPVRAFAG